MVTYKSKLMELWPKKVVSCLQYQGYILCYCNLTCCRLWTKIVRECKRVLQAYNPFKVGKGLFNVTNEVKTRFCGYVIKNHLLRQ